MPTPRNDLSTAGLEEEEEALENVVAELGGGRLMAASSPIREPGIRERKASRKRIEPPGQVTGSLSSSPKKKNSQMFPKEKRPSILQSDEIFDMLMTDRAAKLCVFHMAEEERKKQKDEKNNSLEKCDDELKMVSIPAGRTMPRTSSTLRQGSF